MLTQERCIVRNLHCVVRVGIDGPAMGGTEVVALLQEEPAVASESGAIDQAGLDRRFVHLLGFIVTTSRVEQCAEIGHGFGTPSFCCPTEPCFSFCAPPFIEQEDREMEHRTEFPMLSLPSQYLLNRICHTRILARERWRVARVGGVPSGFPDWILDDGCPVVNDATTLGSTAHAFRHRPRQ